MRVALLTNPRSERVRGVASLRRRAVRARRGRFVVEGPHAVRELMSYAGSEVLEAYLTADAWAAHPDLARLGHEHGVPLYECTDQVLEVMGEAAHPQGVLAVARPVDVTAQSAVGAIGDGFVVVLSHVRDPGNAGTVIRAADAFGAAAVLISSESVDVYNPKVVRSTAGSLFHLPVSVGTEVQEIIDLLREAGVALWAADGSGPTSLPQADLSGPHAWLLGNEAWGLPEDVQAACDEAVSVPIVGHAESLNLAMAATVCLHASSMARGAG
ncbi:MAG TPA: RNA methyltransferase [Ornithinimicrobium sp.]|uniref:TrmH family RNA methyltransferase n=1 Tax=Ornithinimicrobium sp. TaxID=1977084 RepID=UPI002B46AB34|nr:RNA methyltransferase [Ornithinimicrobium sp.]HKJ12048.1 RNA methyltransferase [Ornithinimicrobium sp.]